MANSTTWEGEDPVTLFNELQEELKAEATLAPEKRNHQHREATLKKFLEAGATEEEHEMWRKLAMLQEMEELHRRIFNRTNPHLKRIARMEASKEIYEYYYYFEEVDAEGKTQAQRDQEQATRHITITRLRLELLAAEKHLSALGLKTNTYETNRTDNPDAASQPKNERPILSYQGLREELSRELHSDGAIKKAAEESIKKALKAGKLPYKMVQCANGYQVIDLGTYRTPKGNPSKDHCTYQKM